VLGSNGYFGSSIECSFVDGLFAVCTVRRDRRKWTIDLFERAGTLVQSFPRASDTSSRVAPGARAYVTLKLQFGAMHQRRSVEPPEMGEAVAFAQVGGLHHRYTRRLAVPEAGPTVAYTGR